MLDMLIKNASELVTCKSSGPKIGGHLDLLDVVEGGDIGVKEGKIVAIGDLNEDARHVLNATGKTVLPGFVDCHTHLVFSGSREDEFALKVKGTDYLQILKQGGGILSTVRCTRETTLPDLVAATHPRMGMASDYGTTTMEVKSGYGLDFSNELKMLTVVQSLQGDERMELVPTFLGAHVVPPEFANNRGAYVDRVIEMVDEFRAHCAVEYCDAFVEEGAFTTTEARKILTKARDRGWKLKLHAGEFSDIGGVEMGLEMGTDSIDHLDHISEQGMKQMADKGTVGVLLPGVPFHLMTGHYAPARRMVDAGVPIALATDFNPGSCPTLSMQMIIALACRYMKLTPAEALNASTINAAHALGRGDRIGSLEVGKQADIAILSIANHRQLPYWFGMNLVERVIKNGRIVK